MSSTAAAYHDALQRLFFSEEIRKEFTPIIALPSNVFDELRGSMSAVIKPSFLSRAFTTEVLYYFGHVVMRDDVRDTGGVAILEVWKLIPTKAGS